MNGLNVAEAKTTETKKSQLMSQHTRTTLLICGAAITVVVAGFLIWWQQREPSTSVYQPVIALMQQNNLPLDRPGHCNLSKNFPGLTPRDELLFTRRTDGSFLILFPTKYGEGTQVTGLMYTSRPLTADDTYLRPSPIHYSDRLIDIGGYGGLLIDDRVDEHWYHVSYRIR